MARPEPHPEPVITAAAEPAALGRPSRRPAPRRRARLAAVVAGIVVASVAGCVVPPPPPPPTYPGLAAGGRYQSPTYGGQTRSLYLYVPAAVAAAPNTPVPLVVALHGGGGYAGQLSATSNLKAAADRDGFVLVFPEGQLLPRPNGVSIRTFDSGNCCAPAMGSGIDDVGFVAWVIADLEQQTAIDRRRVVIAGHSNGAMLAWRIACERADVVAGAVVVEGQLGIDSCTPSRGVDLRQIHGDADTFVPLAGGVGATSFSQTDYVSAAASQALWTAGQGCTGSSPSTQDHLTITTWTGCAGGTTSRLIVISGGTHAWPGADPATSADFLGEPSPYLSATDVIADLVQELGS